MSTNYIKRVYVYDNQEDAKFAQPFDYAYHIDNFDGILLPNHHYFCILKKESWEKIRESNQLGLRGNDTVGYLQSMDFLNLGNGCAVTVLPHSEWMSWVKEKMIKFFKSPDYGKSKVDPLLESIFITKDEEVDQAFERLSNWTESWFGLDYETSGLTHEQHFKVIGVGIATNKFAYYFDWRYLNLDTYLPKYKKFLDKFANKCLVKNIDFEQEATYRYLKRFYDFKEMTTLKVLQGVPPSQAGSLKYIARDILKVPSWDNEYEKLLETGTYKDHYPDRIKDFEELINMGYDTVFTRIPTDIIGKYCNLDSYYTLMSYHLHKDDYSDLCWQVYFNNYAAKNRLSGIFVDTEETKVQKRTSQTLYIMGTYYILERWLEYLLDQHPKDYLNYVKDPLLSHGILTNRKDTQVVKDFMGLIYSDDYPHKINTEKLEELIGDKPEFLQFLYDNLPEDWTPSIFGRKRKLKDVIFNNLKSLQDGINLASIEEPLDLYVKLNYLRDNDFKDLTYDEIYEKDEFRLGSNTFDKLGLHAEFLNIHRLTSPDLYTVFHETMTNHLTGNEEMVWTILHLSSGSKDMEEVTGIKSYKEQYEKLFNNKDLQGVLQGMESGHYIRDLDRTPNWLWNILPDEVRKYVGNEQSLVDHLLDDLTVPDDPVLRYFKFEVFRSCFKKYGKIITTYLEGIMERYNKKMHKEDCNLHSIPYFDGEDDSDVVVRSYPKFDNNSCFSKRWSSPYHTIPSESVVKRNVSTPDTHLLSYFDIKLTDVINLN